jgi:hypothetical protein
MDYYNCCAHAEYLIDMFKNGLLNPDYGVIIFWNVSCMAIT